MIKNYFILLLFTSTVIISGCISEKNMEEEKTLKKNDDHYLEDFFEYSVPEGEEPVVANIPIYLDHNNISKIIIRVLIEDGDTGTNPDRLDMISISNFDMDGNLIFDTEKSYSRIKMPCNEEFNLSSDDNYLFGSFWTVALYVRLSASDDQWPGPFIWQGEADSGFYYSFDIEYEYF